MYSKAIRSWYAVAGPRMGEPGGRAIPVLDAVEYFDSDPSKGAGTYYAEEFVDALVCSIHLY